MGENKWTAEQLEAIEARGCDLLISAAAGSGKTAVLVERIIRRITTDQPPLDIDRLLVVTYTKAAATEMKQRVGMALAKKLETTPENVHIQNQMTLLTKGDIKTIHAFCLQVIKEYYHILEIDPAIRTADPGEVQLLQKEILEDYFEELYADTNSQWFFQLLETFGEETQDRGLKKLVGKLYSFACGFPQPKKALESMIEPFNLTGEETLDRCIWIGLIEEAIKDNVSFARKNMEQAMRLASSQSGFEAYLEFLEREDDGFEALEVALKERDYKKWHMAYLCIAFERLPSYRGEEKDIAKEIKDFRDIAKETYHKIQKTYFCYGEEMQSQLIRQLYPVAKGLVTLTIGFMERFALGKKEKLIIDFQDYEHFALKILVNETSTMEKIIPTEAARELQGRYDEIMIDEYQDSNMVQEMILCSISGESQGENNRFMVGDVKQSIYRFRLAMPEIFNEKYNGYPLEKGGKCRKIILAKNFRSRKNVLDGINFMFQQLMSSDFGEVDYNEEVALYAGAEFPQAQPDQCISMENELILVETQHIEQEFLGEEIPKELESLQEIGRQELELRAIVKRIKELIEEGFSVVDHETGNYRLMEYRDIAILFRSAKGWGTAMEDVFGKEGIPYYAETALGYFDVPEVDTMLNLLQVLDNPRQDIPLIATLQSPLYDLYPEELIKLRLKTRDGLFFDTIAPYLEEVDDDISQKLYLFLNDLQVWREKSLDLSLYELISLIYDESGYYDYVGMSLGGNLRQGNLRLLLEKAEEYEKGSRKGLFFFIRYIEDLKTAESEPSSAKLESDNGNLIRVMTIHKSKGLEFPVVFVADAGKGINQMDAKEAFVSHQAWGFAMDYTDLEKRVKYQTLCKVALGEAIKRDTLSEELRVLYVALTRAKEKLIITGTVKNLEKAMTQWAMVADKKTPRFSVAQLRRCKRYLDWIVPALLCHPQGEKWGTAFGIPMTGNSMIFKEESSNWKFYAYEKEAVIEPFMMQAKEQMVQQNLFECWDSDRVYSEERENIFEKFLWEYPYLKSTQLQGKVSISEIKRRFSEDEITYDPQIKLEFPSQMEPQTTELTTSQIGTAMHTVMEFLDLRKSYTKADLDESIENLVERNILEEKEALALRRKEILDFFQSSLAKRMQQANIVERERTFAMLVSASEVYPNEEYKEVEDKILINGIIDCYFIEGESLVLVDYKSDRIYKEEEFKKRYLIQLKLYAKALGAALDKKVEECYIYSFALGREVLVEL